MELSFHNIVGVLAVALAAPLIVNLAPQLRLPAVALEILLGLVVGPSVLGWIEADEAVQVLSAIGLGYLLFLAGMEIDLDALRSRLGPLGLAFGCSAILAFVLGFGLHLLDANDEPFFLAIVLMATSLSLVVPILRETGQSEGDFGQLVLAAASMGEFGSLILLSVFFSGGDTSPGGEMVLFVAFASVAFGLTVLLATVGRSLRALDLLDRLGETPAQLGVRFLLVVMGVFIALATRLGFEAILGSFAAGILLKLTDRSGRLDDVAFKAKIEAIGYGFLVPAFFVSSGLTFDLDALLDSPSSLVLIPVLLGGMLIVRGVPVLLYRDLPTRKKLAAAFLQAINLSIVVIATQIGLELEVIDAGTAAALLAAGILSVLIYPPIALAFLGEESELEEIVEQEEL